jgi:heme/copper-type cytochrome/quinol oxidase subunit 2
MQKKELVAIILVVLATVGTVLGAFGFERYRRQEFSVELIARAPEHGNWYPRKVRVPYGEEVRILIRNIDTVTHGFAIPDLNIAVKEIKGGEVKVVKFTPDKNGVFPFMCTVWCSEHHLEMRGELIVE